MAIVHTYTMTAREGSAEALATALQALAEAVAKIAGSQGATVLRDRKEPAKFLFLEYWADEASRNAAGPQLPKEVMGDVMAAQGGPVVMAGYDRILG